MSNIRRGFGAMAPERQLEIARKGGRNVPASQRSFSQNRELAKEAGKKGGSSVLPQNRSFSKNRKLAREAGKKGGEKSRKLKSLESS